MGKRKVERTTNWNDFVWVKIGETEHEARVVQEMTPPVSNSRNRNNNSRNSSSRDNETTRTATAAAAALCETPSRLLGTDVRTRDIVECCKVKWSNGKCDIVPVRDCRPMYDTDDATDDDATAPKSSRQRRHTKPCRRYGWNDTDDTVGAANTATATHTAPYRKRKTRSNTNTISRRIETNESTLPSQQQVEETKKENTSTHDSPLQSTTAAAAAAAAVGDSVPLQIGSNQKQKGSQKGRAESAHAAYWREIRTAQREAASEAAVEAKYTDQQRQQQQQQQFWSRHGETVDPENDDDINDDIAPCESKETIAVRFSPPCMDEAADNSCSIAKINVAHERTTTTTRRAGIGGESRFYNQFAHVPGSVQLVPLVCGSTTGRSSSNVSHNNPNGSSPPYFSVYLTDEQCFSLYDQTNRCIDLTFCQDNVVLLS